ncbi:sigma-S stabilization anti-adapter protein IraP [Xenorhabdus bovienii]|uniref:sigma-S stabilization anti-adapter protein IraP n=1 Tax=Xenorhabdus bovienii TaxID=40576 RepID=UPI00237D0A06|nr:sigma-S stabilization anti-adapter protein IraP [Xenorhabdus bovienii]MDE1484732.1 hypothetical protein [Xenorhabdus bovienii]MDE9467445.1 hypothetical protein [Xenorhabdus bovienii]MDE9471223.1 hypothetical protein [Xenorhabdus bovienii]
MSDDRELKKLIEAQKIIINAIVQTMGHEQKQLVMEKISSLAQGARYPHLLESFDSPEEAIEVISSQLDLI